MIVTNQNLVSCAERLNHTSWIGLDTEADSLHAYPEKLCLIQLAFEGGEALIDPLAGIDLNPLWSVLQNHQLILHGADYDLRLLRKTAGFVPETIFDTMLASRLVGCRQFGLTDLVSKYLGVALEKGPQKANWARRPLTPRMEEYALNDTRFLQPLAEILRGSLKEKGRLTWHEDSCERLIADATKPSDPDPDQVWRVKGCHQLGPDALAVLRSLWYWRELEATAANKPPYFILSPDSMINLSLAGIESRPLEPLLSRRMSPRRCEGIRNAVARGLADPDRPQLPRRHGHRPTDAEQKRFAVLEQRRNARAEELDLDPTLLASRATLITLSRDWDTHQSDLMPWQRELLR